MGFGTFIDRWFEPDAVFEYRPMAARDSGRDRAVEFREGVARIMEEKIRHQTHFVASPMTIASEPPIDFLCQQDLERVGETHEAATSFRLMMAASHEVGPNDRFTYVRV